MRLVSVAPVLVLAFVLSAAWPAAPAAAADADWRIEAGKRVGPITAATRKADLAKLFTGAAVKHERWEMTGEDVTTVKRGRDLDLVLYWGEQGGPLERVFVLDRAKRWTPASGIRAGMTVAEMTRLNGRPFLIYQFTNEELEDGSVHDWRGGKLPAALKPRFSTKKKLPEAFHERAFPSDHPAVAGLGFTVDAFFVVFRAR